MKNETICNSTTLTAASFGYATKASKETLRGRKVIVNKARSFVLYPNPAINNINIVSSSIIKQIDIYNSLGKRIISKTLNTKNDIVNLNGLQKGVYLIRVTNDKGIINIDKFIKVE